MKDIRIDFTQSEPCLDSKELGEYGEKGVERFVITPPKDMSENPAITNYVVAFARGEKTLRLPAVAKTNVLYVPVEEAAALGTGSFDMQLEGHNDDDSLIIKTKVVEGILFAKSLPECCCANLSGERTSGHFHNNLEVLGKLSESEGSLVYDGKAIGARNIKTVELTAADNEICSYTDHTTRGTIHFIAPSGIPEGVEILRLEVMYDYGDIAGKWIDLKSFADIGVGYFPIITQLYKSFYMEEYLGVCVGIRYYLNYSSDVIYEASQNYSLVSMRVTYAEESGDE